LKASYLDWLIFKGEKPILKPVVSFIQRGLLTMRGRIAQEKIVPILFILNSVGDSTTINGLTP